MRTAERVSASQSPRVKVDAAFLYMYTRFHTHTHPGSFFWILNLSYKVGVVDGGSNAILDYLKNDLSDRVNDIKTKQEAVGEKVTTISSEVTAKMDAQNVKAAADLKRCGSH